jgi:hypothetical protein
MRLITCDECGDEQPDYIMDHGLCPCCRGAVVDENDLYSDSHITDTAYCCGMIYENGEEVCFSCGESLWD